MATPFTGGCRCGAIRYQCSAEPVMAGNCHCRECQRACGSAFGANIAVPIAALKITGNIKYYEYTADSGNTVGHGFCPNCGAPLVGRSSGLPELIAIRVGSLDDPSWYQPAMSIYVDSAQPWDYLNPNLPKFPKMPQM